VFRVIWAVIIVLAFFLGAALASAAVCLYDRSKAHQPWGGMERSRCPSCGHVLNWVDLIPFLGFLIRKGKCHYCGVRIPKASFIAELITGVVFAAATYIAMLVIL